MNKRGGLLVLSFGLSAFIIARANARSKRVMNFHTRTVVITGGSRGLGLVMARQLAAKGANLAIVARDAEELARAREDLSEYRVEIMTIACDLTDRVQAESMIAQVQARFGDIDVLINNAGTIQVGPMEEMTLRRLRRGHADALLRAPLPRPSPYCPTMRRRQKRAHRQCLQSIGGKNQPCRICCRTAPASSRLWA